MSLSETRHFVHGFRRMKKNKRINKGICEVSANQRKDIRNGGGEKRWECF